MRICASLLSLLALSASPAVFLSPDLLPVDRLVSNIDKAISTNPDDPLLHYNKARLLYLALVGRSDHAPSYRGRNGGPRRAPGRHFSPDLIRFHRWKEAYRMTMEELGPLDDDSSAKERAKKRSELNRAHMKELEAADWRPEPASPQSLREYADKAMHAFDLAIELDPDNALYHLGRASLGLQILQMEESGEMTKRADQKDLADLDLVLVRDQLYRTFELGIEADKALEHRPIGRGLEEIVSYEAARTFLDLCSRSASLQREQKERVRKVEKGLEELGKIPRSGKVTPILFADHAGAQLEDLLDPSVTTDFNLDGLGRGDSWPWLKPDTAILVWDPYEEANITSGWQLFGSVSFRLFLRDGYQALSLLDDDGDGYLRDSELSGLALWRDANQDGRSCPEEVVPVWREGITAIATRPQEEGAILQNRSGVHYEDGRQLPSFDWVTGPRIPH